MSTYISKRSCLFFFFVVSIATLEATQFSWPGADRTPEKWIKNAKDNIDTILKRKFNGNIAKNLIMFLGDGMGITTITAGRIRKGQLKNRSGEEEITFMESLENLALSKTYNVDAQTPDSAGTATAYLCGVKTGVTVVGLNGHARAGNCESSIDTKVDSILKWAHRAGKLTGIVTTTRITHATPAAAYAHAASRKWEGFDGREFSIREESSGCSDIASQLIQNNSFINVIFGGGRRHFIPIFHDDYGTTDRMGDRHDRRHLINEWISKMKNENRSHKFLWNATELRDTNMSKLDHVLGLFAHDHMEFEVDRNPEVEPSIIEMTEKAIELLETGENGFFLLVEGGRIDHGHHESKAKKALEEFVVFDEAIGSALRKTSTSDTLLVVTADHSHTFSIGGNSARGNDVYGVALKPDFKRNTSDAGYTFTSLLYGNGPGGIREIRKRNLTNEETNHKNYIQESGVYLRSETHGSEDVAIYASGPMGHLFEGTVEQSYIPHAMAYAACIGPIYGQNRDCYKYRGTGVISRAHQILSNTLPAFCITIIIIFKNLHC